MKLVEFFKKINNLKRIPRMGWIESGISPPECEDVAQHSFETASISLLLINYIKKEIDQEKVLKMAILHDWAETEIGDLSKEATERIGSEVKENLELRVLKEILLEDGLNKKAYLDLWKEYNEKETDEAKLVFVADRLSMLIEADHLFENGKSSEKLEEIWEAVKIELSEYKEDFPILTEILENLERNDKS